MYRGELLQVYTSMEDKHFSPFLPIKPNDEAYAKSLRSREFILPHLSKRQQANRSAILNWWIKTSRELLQLRFRTIDIAIKLFDNYCYLKSQQGKSLSGYTHILESQSQINLTTTACFFSAAKYNEIYPPGLNNFIFLDQEHLSKRAVILKQVDIVNVTKCGYNYAILTDWYYLISDTPCPDWGYQFLLSVPNINTELLAQAICEVDKIKEISSQSRETLTLKILVNKNTAYKCEDEKQFRLKRLQDWLSKMMMKKP